MIHLGKRAPLRDTGRATRFDCHLYGNPWRFDGASVTGTDLYKYQLGGGVALSLANHKVDVFAEGIAFGERGIAAGVGTTFF